MTSQRGDPPWSYDKNIDCTPASSRRQNGKGSTEEMNTESGNGLKAANCTRTFETDMN